MAIEYREYVNEDGKYREFTNEHGVVQRELIEASDAFHARNRPTWEQFGIRERRNGYLDATDWTLLPDSPLTSDQQSEATQYRQMLRDFPENYTDVFEAKDAINNLRPENTLSFLK